MRKIVFTCFLIFFGSIGISLLLIPKEVELIYMQFKDKRYDEVKAGYEELLDSNNLSSKIVYPLMETYKALGEYDRAVDLLEQYLDQNPNNVEVHYILNSMYHDFQQNEKYFASLISLGQIQMDPIILNKLFIEYVKNENYPKVIETLKKLVEMKSSDINYMSSLAYFQANAGDLANSMNTLLQINQFHAESMSLKDKKMLFSLLIENERTEFALALAKEWFNKKGIENEVIHFSQWLLNENRAKLSLAILKNVSQEINQNPELLRIYVHSEILAGERGAAFSRLQSCHGQGVLSEELIPLYIELALEHKKYDVAKAAIFSCEPILLSNWLRMKIVDSALESSDENWLKQFLSYVENDWLEKHPLVSAKIAFANQKYVDARRYISQLTQGYRLTLNEKLSLAKLLVQLKQLDDASVILKEVVNNPSIPEMYFRDIAILLLTTEQFIQGHAIYNSLNNINIESLSVAIGWALLSAKNGEFEKVSHWLVKDPYIDQQSLLDLYLISQEAKHTALALLCARRMFKNSETNINRHYLVHALLEHAPQDQISVNEALDHLSELDIKDSKTEYLYVKALTLANNKKALSEHWINLLENHNLLPEKKTEIVYNLLNIDCFTCVLPYLHDYARTKNGEWVFLYADTAIKAGETALAINILKQFSYSSHANEKEKRMAAYRLLELDQKAEAISLLKSLIETGKWKKTDLQQLTYLLGPRPASSEKQWIIQQIDNTNSKMYEHWMPILFKIGEYKELIRRYEKSNKTTQEILFKEYIESLLKEHQHEKLAGLIKQEMAVTESIVRLERFVEIGYEIGNIQLTKIAWLKILDITPKHSAALRDLGLLAYSEKEYIPAYNYLDQYLSLKESDIEAYYFFGEVLNKLNRRAESDIVFHNIVAKLEKLTDLSYQNQSLKLLALARLDRIQQSKQIFVELVNMRSGDLKLLNDYIEILYEKGFYHQAEQLLATYSQR